MSFELLEIARIKSNDVAKLASLYKDAAEGKKAKAAFEARLSELDQSAAKVLASDAAWSMKNRCRRMDIFCLTGGKSPNSAR